MTLVPMSMVVSPVNDVLEEGVSRHTAWTVIPIEATLSLIVHHISLLWWSTHFIPSYPVAVLTRRANKCHNGHHAPPWCCISMTTNAHVHHLSWGWTGSVKVVTSSIIIFPRCPLVSFSSCKCHEYKLSHKLSPALPQSCQHCLSHLIDTNYYAMYHKLLQIYTLQRIYCVRSNTWCTCISTSALS